MLNGLDLFSGIGGLTIALRKWVRPVAYCEIDRYCQAVLLSRMASGELPVAPIWDDIATLHDVPIGVDIAYGGFPCQDISAAGARAGLEGERSGLFFELIRLLRELRPRFCFLENVPAITSRGGWRVAAELTALRYDCRWGMLSAYDMGAPHYRERFWLLAHANSIGCSPRDVSRRRIALQRSQAGQAACRLGDEAAYADSTRLEKPQEQYHEQLKAAKRKSIWAVEPDVGRVANGIPRRVGRVKALGNAVVPQCAEEAFRRLMGLTAGEAREAKEGNDE